MTPNLLSNVARFARTSQGRALAEDTVRRAREPKTRRQIEQVRARLAERTARRAVARGG